MHVDPRIPLPRGWPQTVRSAVIHAISLAQFSVTHTRSWAADSWNARIRLKQENDRLRQEVALLVEEMRIKDARMLRIPAQRRPHYPPIERLAVLELRAARCWSMSQTARHLLVAPATVASWMGRLDEEGPRAIVQTREPVNKSPDFVRYIVQRLKALCPSMGKVKIAQVLCRVGLHLAPTTIARMLRQKPPRRNRGCVLAVLGRVVTAKRPNHVWLSDLTTVPTSLGFWCSWLPFALPQRRPFCWWLAVAVDHYSRRIMGFAVFDQQPTSEAVRTFLGRAIRQAGTVPRHLITDQGTQFTDERFGRWCRCRGIRQRFGAVGKFGSIAVIERLIRTIKNECTRRLLIPYRRDSFRRELTLFATWYNGNRPSEALTGKTPDEVYHDLPPACLAPRFEPRRKWPRGSPCAAPRTGVRGRRGVRLELNVNYLAGRKHLPIVALKRAA
jgi:transposase InsO family protein